MFPEWTVIVGLMLGATIGSFLNVVIYRMPRLLSLGHPKHSFCPKCKHQLGIADLVPLFSWLTSKGKCRHCANPVPSRYFWVELFTGFIWAGIWWRYFVAGGIDGDWVTAVAYMLGSAALVAIIFIDWEFFIIPDEINAFLLFVGLIYWAAQGSFMTAIWGWLAGWGVIFGIALLGRIGFGKDSMGHGDIKMMRGVGAILGVGLTFVSIGIAVFAGAVLGSIFLVISNRQQSEAKTSATKAVGSGGSGIVTGAACEGEPEAVVEPEEEEMQPEPIKDLIILGATYLVGLDVLECFKPGLYAKLGYPMEQESVEDDDWKPSLTMIPFGPYLALGTLICMLLKTPIETALNSYVQSMSGNPG